MLSIFLQKIELVTDTLHQADFVTACQLPLYTRTGTEMQALNEMTGHI